MLRVGRRWTAVVVGCSMLVSACYTSVPLHTSVNNAPSVVLTVNDRGRVGLENRMGPEVNTIEGTLINRTDSTYTLRVSAVTFLNGTVSKWTGEEEQVRTDYVRDANERRLSTSRSLLVGAIVAVAVGTFIATRGVFGFGGGDSSTETRGGPQTSLRAP